MGEQEESPEINNIDVIKLDNNRFRVVFGRETEIPDLYSASASMELDRALLEQFVANAKEALAGGE